MPQTLLLADDSVTIQRVIELTFADEDILVVAVSDGDQAIERLEAAPPDIVLADVGMPGRNGYEVAQYIKTSPKLAHIPVLLLTGAFEPVDQAKAAEAGCDGVLAKPFEPQLVIGRVKELLAKPRHAAASLDADVTPVTTRARRGSPLVDQLSGASTPVQPPAEDYFARLEAAFANLAAAAPDAPKQSAALAAAGRDEIDWFGAQSQSQAPAADRLDLAPRVSPTEPVDLPLSYAVPQIDFDKAAVRSTSAQPPVPTPPRPPAAAPRPSAHAPTLTSAPPLPVALPPIADAFAALLAAERNEPPPAAAAAAPAQVAAGRIDTDDLIEQVTRRVLERLSDRVVRETVADIVSKVAERLVREEIERIKASVK